MSEAMFDFLGLKPKQEENPGLKELHDVLFRLSHQAGLGHTPEQIGHIANHLYSGNHFIQGSPYGPDAPEVDQRNWRTLAALTDHRLTDEQLVGEDGEESMPFGRPARELRKTMWKDWSGPGWSRQEEQALGRPKQPYELSPGDRVSHQWMRDRQFLGDILDRNEVELPPAETMAWGGSPSKEHYVKNNIDQALHWYRKGKDATHTFPHENYRIFAGVPFLGQLPGLGGEPNFRHYQTNESSGNWMVNPDSTIGAITTKIATPTEDFANQVTMANPEQGSGHTPVITPIKDFFSNLREHGGQALKDSYNKAEAAQFVTHSPRLPTTEMHPSHLDRIRMLRDIQKAYEDSRQKEGGDWHREKTGEEATGVGKFAMRVGSSLMDPSLAFTVGSAGLGAMAKGATVAGKAGAIARGAGTELGQELAENVGVMSMFEGLEGGQWKSTKPDTVPNFEHKMIEEEKTRKSAAEALGKANDASRSGYPSYPIFGTFRRTHN